LADREDPERDRLTGRVRRFAQVGTGLAGAGVAYGASRIMGGSDQNARNAKLLKEALGGLKGPLMKAAQMFATVPDFLPPEYAAELAELQTNAPAMGRPFVKRRMASELGQGWETRFASFDLDAAHAASLGQVHKAVSLEGQPLAVKLQYPEMASAVETDVSQLRTLLNLFRRTERAIDPSEALEEIAARLREELDYDLEAKHIRLYRGFFQGREDIAVPEPVEPLSTRRLLTMGWLDGQGLLNFKTAPLEVRNRIAMLLFEAWWAPMTHIGVIHGDPHLGNYTFAGEGASRLNLLDFGCVRKFPPIFVAGVVRLYNALLNDDRGEQYESYRTWGFDQLNDDLVDALNVWARFIYGPLLDDRVRTVADGVEPGAYGRREAFKVRQALKEKGPVLIPREFVFMDRAAIGLGAAFLHLGAELNWKQLFDKELEGFSESALAERQKKALAGAGLA
jgi:predicted unusual protein kinase regulating ubiquinone biosynthesis (AarF/ABC1/UbiB family)